VKLTEQQLDEFRKFCGSGESELCWLWQGSKDGSGYGKIGTGSNILSAHRVAYTLYKGPIPPGFHVRHTCDTPACVNPKHLCSGTAKENKQDSVARNRHHRPAGELNGNAVATEATVRTVKKLFAEGKTISQVMHSTGLKKGMLRNIKVGASWKHIT